jgi:hypothetical protein
MREVSGLTMEGTNIISTVSPRRGAPRIAHMCVGDRGTPRGAILKLRNLHAIVSTWPWEG